MKDSKTFFPPKQVIAIVVLTTLFRFVMPYVMELLHWDPRTGEKVIDTVQIYPLLLAIGAALYLFALFIFVIERKRDLPFWYGKSQSGGSNANGAIIASLAMAICMLSPLLTAVCVVITILVLSALNHKIETDRKMRKEKFASQKGISLTELKFKGYADFGGEKVRVISKEVIPADCPIVAVGINGFDIVVERAS